MQAWKEFLENQVLELGDDTVSTWLRPLKILRFDAGNLYLQASTPFQIHWFEQHIRKKINRSFFNNNHRLIKVHLSLASQPAEQGSKKTKEAVISSPPAFTIQFDSLDPQCTFESFLPAASLLPYKLLLGLVEGEQFNSATFNPIYLYGLSGTGKTHLLMATANALQAKGVKVIYVRMETFTEHVVNAIKAGEMGHFRESYRNADLLILDDIHSLSKKWATQEELFHTFNTLHIAGKQIIVSANCAPTQLQFVEPRLVSRFEWGIVLQLEFLQKEERKQLLQIKIDQINFPLHHHVAEYFIDTFQTAKSVCRSLSALALRSHLNETYSRLTSTQLTVQMVQHLLADLIEEEDKQALTIPKIVQHTVEYFGICVEDVLGKGQSKEFVLPRQMAMYFSRKQLKLPFQQIAKAFGKDHSTVMSSVKLVQKGLETNHPDICTAHNEILKKLYS